MKQTSQEQFKDLIWDGQTRQQTLYLTRSTEHSITKELK